MKPDSPLLQLLVVGRLLDQIQDLRRISAAPRPRLASQRDTTHLVGELGIGQRESLGVRGGHRCLLAVVFEVDSWPHW